MCADSRLSVFHPRLPGGAHDALCWAGLNGSSPGLAVARASDAYDGPVVLVVPTTSAAMRIADELRYYVAANTAVLHFPDWETLPYDVFSPHQDIISQRLAALYRLPEMRRGILVAPVATLMGRVAPREYLLGNTFLLERGDPLDLSAMRERLDSAGYRCVSQVMEHGEFAVRGSLLDLFPMGSPHPFRIDLLDEEIDTLRAFDPETQRSTDTVQALRLIPAREFPSDDAGVGVFRQAWRARFEGDATNCPIYRDVSQGLMPSGIEYYLPLFFEHTASLFDYLPGNSLFIVWKDAHDAAEAFWHEACERYESRRFDTERPVLAPSELFLPGAEVFRAVSAFARVDIGHVEDMHARETVEFATRAPPSLPVDARSLSPFVILERFVAEFPGRVLFVAETPGRREMLLESLRKTVIRPSPCADWHAFVNGTEPLGIMVGALEDGVILEAPNIAVITESQLFGKKTPQDRRRHVPGKDAESIIRDLTELNTGAAVVHEHHGVGRYQGLQTLTVGGMTNEFLTLHYAGGDKLYVPVSSLHLVTRYAGADAEHAPLHKLGSAQWQRARKRAAERAFDVAAELLEIHARRAARTGHRFEIRDDEYRTFERAFPFEETPDQHRAIDCVIENMGSSAPMDRLVCGDVGFGKTEVAMRAAFVAVQDGWQVAVLVPTTLLAQQHHQTFSDRFADWPVRVDLLSRFRTGKQQGAVLSALASGDVDIVIATHKLLQKDILFKRLGLLIIDEEHRFGVRQKERIKALRAEVDILTLTATPIPRTLNMALAGLRDLTLIGTPPEHRLSIKTFVRQWDNALLREACLREVRRGGQVFFVHNKVQTIQTVAAKLEGLTPEARVRVAHGQMRERVLEQVMLDFYHRRFNILVCTTIIETGIDVPNANTIIINRADHFGLAQLHQLRGRVGRSHHRAYAYLVVPPRQLMTNDAVKRLEAIESLEDLGIGFTLATHDLEIRGAGELLGEEQSGQIHEVGYSMYTELLERAVRELKAGRNPQLDRPLDHGTEIDIHAPARIPDDYLPDVHTRLLMYKRIASAPHADALRELAVEMIDRFGLLPEPTRTLFSVTELKLEATPLGIRKADLGPHGGTLRFHPEPDIDPGSVIHLVQSEPHTYRFDGRDRLRLTLELPDAGDRLKILADLLRRLDTRAAA